MMTGPTDDQVARTCPKPCPQLGKSDPGEPELRGSKALQINRTRGRRRKLQNRQGVTAPRLEGSIPSPLRACKSTATARFGARVTARRGGEDISPVAVPRNSACRAGPR